MGSSMDSKSEVDAVVFLNFFGVILLTYHPPDKVPINNVKICPKKQVKLF